MGSDRRDEERSLETRGRVLQSGAGKGGADKEPSPDAQLGVDPGPELGTIAEPVGSVIDWESFRINVRMHRQGEIMQKHIDFQNAMVDIMTGRAT